ncbi:MAG: VOC family protein [Proteobacteria bacterium]|nr:VOC family protein [Pseudomonadota bacterium]
MSIRFEGPAVFVENMGVARKFYEGLLGLEVQFAVADAYTAYVGGMSLWSASSASELIHGRTPTEPPGPQGRGNFELYFESDAIVEAWDTIEAAGAPVVHGVREMPWSQRCFRIQDPDGHLVEVGEPMPLVIRRLLDTGLSAQEVADRTMAPLEMVQAVAKG